jgi:hypothetical protein
VINVRHPVLRSGLTGVIHATTAGMIAQKGRRSDGVLPSNSFKLNEIWGCIREIHSKLFTIGLYRIKTEYFLEFPGICDCLFD